MKRKNCVSSKDVAREAGVSQATVSYILNNVQNVKIRPETREAVLNAIKKLNYHPDQIARGMKLKKSMSVGVVTDRNVTNFNFMKTLEGIRDGLQQQNYSLTLHFSKSESLEEAEFIRYYNTNRLDGIIFSFASVEEEMVDYMNEKGIPYVVVDAHSTGKDVHEVCSDHLNHIVEVIQYLQSKGIQRIGYVGPQFKSRHNGRKDAFVQAMKAQGLEIHDLWVALSVFGDQEIMDAVMPLLTLKNRPDALLAGSPRFGLLTVKCALQLGFKIPQELSIVALGTSNFYHVIHPSLSAVELPLYDMGFQASQMLLQIIEGQLVDKTIVLLSEFVIRDSC